MTDLAIFGIFDYSFSAFRIEPDDIGWAGFDTDPAADASVYLVNSHFFLLILKLNFPDDLKVSET